MPYTDLNAELVEEFGSLERLCDQIYNARHGVTCYINDMESTYGGSRIENWNQDLKQLKDIRHKRNNLSHGEVSFSSPWATEEDIDFVVDFRDRIINCNDPLSQYRRAVKSKSDPKMHTTQNDIQSTFTHSQPSYTPPSKPARKPVGCAACLTLFIIIVAATLWHLF